MKNSQAQRRRRFRRLFGELLTFQHPPRNENGRIPTRGGGGAARIFKTLSPLSQGLIIPSGEWRNSLLLLNVNCAQLRVTRRFRERVKVRLN